MPAVLLITVDGVVVVIVGMVAGIGVVTAIWVFAGTLVAWPWFVPIGTAVTVMVGWTLGRGTSGPEVQVGGV